MGIDYGTGGGKACITDDELNMLAYAYREYPIYTDHPGFSEHDPEMYWKVTCEIIQECVRKSGVNPKDIVALSTSSALPAMVMVDEQGNIINRAYNLMDRRATREVEWIKEHIGEKRVFEVSANRLEDHPSLVNLLWEKNNRPDDFKRIRMVHTIDSFIKYRLTGVSDINVSEAAFYGVAYNLYKEEFDQDILDALGIDCTILPQISPCETFIGEVTPKAAAATGLAAGTKVASGQADACAGWLGAGAINVGDIQMNLGTCGNFGVILEKPNFIDSMINFAYTIKGTYVVLPTTTTGGVLMRYMRDNFSPLEVAIEKASGMDSYDLLNMEAAKVAPGCDGLLVLPYLMGERTPIWDVNARGVVFGLSLNHTRAHLIRGMMESVGYALYDSFTVLKDNVDKINYPIVLNEGGAKSKLWRQIITDIFNIPTVLVKNRAGAPFGNCLLAGKIAGIFKNYSIAKERTEYIDPMEPDAARHDMYMDYFGLYKRIYADVRERFVDLAELRSRYVQK
ncbi:MAG: FGGY-family carbohydrate kinase [Christensenellales bacterium]